MCRVWTPEASRPDTPPRGSRATPALACAAWRACERIVGAEHVSAGAVVGDVAVAGVAARALVRPGSAEEVAEVVRWCYERDVPIVPVGGRSGLAGGAAVLDGAAVAIALDRLRAVRSFEPALWRMEAEAGVTTHTIARLARENGLLFAPDPGAPGAVAARRHDRDERRRPACLQVRRDRRVGDRHRGGARAGRARARRRAGAQGRRRL